MDNECQLPMEWIVKVGDDLYYPYSGETISLCDSIQLTKIVSNDGDKVITGVYEMSTGKQLAFDPATGVIKGLAEFFESDDISAIELDVYSEDLDRSKTLNFVLDGTSFVVKKYILADNTLLKTEGSITGSPIKYASAHEPLRLGIYNFKTVIGNNKRTYTYAKVYLNGTLIPETTVSGHDEKLIQLPQNLPDGSVIRSFGSASTGTVNYKIADGIKVNVSHDAEALSAVASTYTLAKGTVLKIEPAADNEVEYRIFRNGVRIENETAANGIAVSNVTENITIEPDIDVLTINAGMDTDLTKISVTDNLDNIYSLSGSSANVSFRGDVTSMKIFNTDPDFYISSVTTNPSTIKYDVTTGELTNLTTDSLTITSKQLERKQEVNIFVDGTELEGAEITLGNGKVIETGQALTQGSQTIQFAEEDLPIIFKVPDSYFGEGGSVPTDPSKMPAVIVNGETLTYSPEHKGYVFPVEAFADPKNPPVIKIYPAEPDLVEISYLVEPGITFKAFSDGDESTAVTEATTLSLLPGTTISLTATADKAGEEIYIEVGGSTVTEDHQVSYDFTVGSQPQTIEIKRKKVLVTVNSEEAWQHVRVNGAGFSYPMYDASSELEFPVGTTQLTFRTTADDMTITGVLNTGAPMNYDVVSGVLSGVSDKMKLTLQTDPMTRDKNLILYLEEGENAPAVNVILAKDKAVEKEVKLRKGYQTVAYADTDIPLSFTGNNVKVYLNNEAVEVGADGAYAFPTTLSENSVVKVYSSEQPKVNVKYDIEAGGFFTVDLKHDQVVAADPKVEHTLLPGTEIRFTVAYSEMGARMIAARRAKGKAADATTEVSVNGEELLPDENGLYSYKVLADHASTGLSFVVKRPDFLDEETGCTYSYYRKTLLSVSPNTEGEVIIPEGVTTIGPNAFSGCEKVTSVVIPETVVAVGENAFAGSGMSTIILPNSVETIGDGAFSGCEKRTTVIIGSGVTEIGKDAFKGSENITEAVYPAALAESLGEGPFPEKAIEVPYTATDLTIDPKTGLMTGVATDAEGNPTDGKVLVFVPSTQIKDGTYEIPADVTVISAGAFRTCDNLTNITIPGTVKEIGDDAFDGCSKLTNVTISEGVETIGAGAFEGTGITSITLPSTTETIGDNAFKGTQISEITIPENVTEIGAGVFSGTQISEVKIPDSVETIGAGAFSDCISLIVVSVPNQVTTIEPGAFSGCSSLTEVNLGSSITEIGAKVFSGCTSLKEVNVHSAVESIGADAFRDCGLTDIHIGAGIESIGENAFAGNNINVIAVTAQTPPTLGANAFGDNSGARLLVQGESAASKYRQAAGWSVYQPEQMIVATKLDSDVKKEIALDRGVTAQLHVTMDPENATLGAIFWESERPDIVTVDNKGLVRLYADNGVTRFAYTDEPIKVTAKTMYANGPTYEFRILDLLTGVEDISIGNGKESLKELLRDGEVYTLSGLKVDTKAKKLEPGIYAVRINGKSRTVSVK